jgi:hypothetical protein
MRKFILMALAGAAIALAAPEFAAAAPFGSGLGAAADNASVTEAVHHRRWHRRWHRHRHCHHRRHWSGRRCW